MRKAIGTLNPGDVFTYAKERFVVLDTMKYGVFCLLEQSGRSAPFHSDVNNPQNNYRKSTLRKEIEKIWLPKLVANGADYKDIVPFDVDLRSTDQSGGYGELLGVPAAPLTLWQYGKYKDIIPFNEGDSWWLVTPFACPWLRSPDTCNTNRAWVVCTNGIFHRSDTSDSYGIRPALKLKSCCQVSVDGEDDDEHCDTKNVDLGGVDTLLLVREVERRLAAQMCGSEPARNGEEDDEE